MKLVTRLLAVISALGIFFFASNILNFSRLFAAGVGITIVGLIVAIIPIMIAGGSMWWVPAAENTKGNWLRLISSSAIAWAWLYGGAIILAIIGFQ